MGDDRARILDLLAAGKITTEEAARLLDALEMGAAPAGGAGAAGAEAEAVTGTVLGAGSSDRAQSSALPKYLYVKVDSVNGDRVNVKVPLGLVKAGLKLTSLIPGQVQDQINSEMAKAGMKFDLNNFKPEDMDDLIEALREMEVDVDATNGDKVRVYTA